MSRVFFAVRKNVYKYSIIILCLILAFQWQRSTQIIFSSESLEILWLITLFEIFNSVFTGPIREEVIYRYTLATKLPYRLQLLGLAVMAIFTTFNFSLLFENVSQPVVTVVIDSFPFILFLPGPIILIAINILLNLFQLVLFLPYLWICKRSTKKVNSTESPKKYIILSSVILFLTSHSQILGIWLQGDLWFGLFLFFSIGFYTLLYTLIALTNGVRKSIFLHALINLSVVLTVFAAKPVSVSFRVFSIIGIGIVLLKIYFELKKSQKKTLSDSTVCAF